MAGSSRRKSPPPIRSADPCRAQPSRARGHGGASSSRTVADLPLPPPPQRRYHGVRQRSWGTWVSEIKDRDIRRRIWIGSYQSAAQAARVYDQQALALYGARARLNFPLGSPNVPEFVLVDRRVVSRRELREDREALERIKAQRTDEAMMAELRRRYPEHVEEERRMFEEYKKEKTDGAGPSSASLIDLCSSDGDGSGSSAGEGGGDDGSDEDVNGELNWEKILAKED